MIFTEAARNLLKHWEAKNGIPNLQAYEDNSKKHVWTIGYGHTGDEVRPGLIWTPQQCEDMLSNDIQKYISAVALSIKNAPVALTDNQFSAMVIFCYNIGIAAFLGCSALHSILQGRLNDVPAAMKLWNKTSDNSGVFFVNEGLVDRRRKEVVLWSTP